MDQQNRKQKRKLKDQKREDTLCGDCILNQSSGTQRTTLNLYQMRFVSSCLKATVSTSDGFKPGIAEKWDVSEDGKTYTFHLRKDAKWSDGSPVTAKDFEYSWRRICDPDFASEALQAITDYVVGATEYFEGTGEYDDIKATAIDDYTFEVVLKNATPFFPQLVANDVYLPIKKEAVEAKR